MSIVTERIEDNVLYLELNGRIDSSNADQAEELIKAIKDCGFPCNLFFISKISHGYTHGFLHAKNSGFQVIKKWG